MRAFLIFNLTWILALPLCGEDWPQFRGPTGEGHSVAKGLPIAWGGFAPPVWQATIPGRGWSSPIVIGERIWLTSAEQLSLPSTAEEKKLAASPAGGLDFQAHAAVSLLA